MSRNGSMSSGFARNPAPPTPPNVDVPTVTRTPLPLNWPSTTASSVAAVLGAVGEDEDEPPLQAVNSVASAAPDATWQAPPQNCRRETSVGVSDIRADS